MACHVEEIAGAGVDTQIATLRETFLEFESSKRVMERMKIQDIQIPFSRQDAAQKQLYGDLLNPAENNNDALEDRHGTTTASPRQWHKELKQLEQYRRDGKLPRVPRVPNNCKTDHSPVHRLATLKAHLRHQIKISVKVDELIQEQEAIDRLHFGILHKALNEPERQSKLAELQQRLEAFKNRLENQTKPFRGALNNNGDNRRAFMKDPPLLMWDRRTAEPLIVREDEFCNPTRLALLDFQPISPNPYSMTSAQSVTFDLLMGGLLNQRNNTIYCLNSLAPGAADAIIPRVPALQDPQRGGRYDLSDLRIRCFTPEMFYGIVQAWDNWPFKPLISEMAAVSEEL
ncbi:hypothetical protein MMC22_003246 [Lobaria immixta]|nr:hypothetical protein [Lobaria immixta]